MNNVHIILSNQLKINMTRIKDHKRRDAAIRYGQEMIQKEGLKNITIRKIAHKLNCSIGTIYNMFKSNDDIILCINAKTLDDIKLFIESRSNPNLSNIEIIKNLADLYIEYAKKNYFCWNAIFEFSFPKIKLGRIGMIKILDLFNLIEIPISLVTKTSTKKDLQLISRTIWSSIHGICVLALKIS